MAVAPPDDGRLLADLARAVSLRLVAGLVAGRAAFRLAQWVSAITLLALWGADVFAGYAIALEVSAWLIVLVAAGAEKALLALVPRRGGEAFVRPLVVVAAVPHAASLIVLAFAALATDDGAAVGYAAAAAYSSGLGLVLVLAALLRVRGRPGHDPLGLGVVAAAHLLVAAAAYGFDLQPRHVLVILAVASTSAVVLLLVQARAHRPPDAPQADPPRARTSPLRVAVLMGAFELSNAASVAVAFAVLGAGSRETEASGLYIALAVSQLFLGLLLYLTRIGAPHASIRAEARGSASPYAEARRVLARAAAAACLAFVAALAAAIVLRESGLGHDIALGVTVAAAAALTAAVLYGCFLLETADQRGRTISARAAVVAFATATAFSLALGPIAGSVGVATALVAGLAAQSTVASYLLRGYRRPATA